MRVAIIGCGYWAKNIVRNLKRFKDVEIVVVCDINPEQFVNLGVDVEKTYMVQGALDVFDNYKFDLLFVLTRADTHYTLAKMGLEHRAHVFVEKPLALNYNNAMQLVDLARRESKHLFVDHTYLLSPEVHCFKNYIDLKVISEPKAIESYRINRGPHMTDINVIWDLAPHDFSILNYLIPFHPKYISANGVNVVNPKVCDKANITIHYDDTDFKAFVHLSWVENRKSRELRLIGKDCELRFDSACDLEPQFINYSQGEPVYSTKPMTKIDEPLYLELNYVFNCLREGRGYISTEYQAAQVVAMLEAADESLRHNGQPMGI